MEFTTSCFEKITLRNNLVDLEECYKKYFFLEWLIYVIGDGVL